MTRHSQFEAAQGSLLGGRQLNQDRCLFIDGGDTLLLGVADGLGGHPRGEVAAQMLIDVTESQFRETPKPLQDPTRFMLECIGKTHSTILRYANRQKPPVSPRTTAVLAIVQRGVVYWTHVGDSRFYLIRDGKILAQTRDHIHVRFVRQTAGSTSQRRTSLTRCLGGLPRPPTTTYGTPTPLSPGDGLLLCSDGLWNQVPQQAIISAFAPRETDMVQRLDDLLGLAATAPNSDNVTAVALRWLATANTDSAAARVTSPAALDQAVAHLEDLLRKAGDHS